jgi:pyruvate dehydrogenase E2 component (dihydrolipoamide acetyltransferase)
MSKDVVMPALGMAQETGTLIRWLKEPGQSVAKGEPLMEIETDKATVEIEAPAAGVLANVTAQPGDVVDVGKIIAVILAPGEAGPASRTSVGAGLRPAPTLVRVPASPIAARMAAEHNLDLAQIKPSGGKIQKEDVLAYLAAQQSPAAVASQVGAGLRPAPTAPVAAEGRGLASPKARRLAQERGPDIRMLAGSGPNGAVLAGDVLEVPEWDGSEAQAPAIKRRLVSTVPGQAGASLQAEVNEWQPPEQPAPGPAEWQSPEVSAAAQPATMAVGRTWRVMVERLSQAWTTIPHFYLLRDINASGLAHWRAEAQGRAADTLRVTYTDLLVKVVASALRQHPRLNAAWQNDNIVLNPHVNIGLAVAIDDGLVVPVIHDADTLGLAAIAARRAELVAKAQGRKLSPADLAGGTFTISNLGMYGVDAFIAIVNPPQAAILSAGRISERAVALNGQPAVAPMMTLGLSCDHRAVDGARAAQFLQTLAERLEAPLSLLD